MSSSQICIAKSDILPLAASGPESAMPKPILIGSAALAGTDASSIAAAVAEHARRVSFSHFDVDILPLPVSGARASGSPLSITARHLRLIRVNSHKHRIDGAIAPVL